MIKKDLFVQTINFVRDRNDSMFTVFYYISIYRS